MRILVVMAVLLGAVSVYGEASGPPAADRPTVTAPPESFFERIAAGRPGRRRGEPVDVTIYRDFYKKYIDIQGMPVLASAQVADEALQRTYEIVTHMLAGRPDILEGMVERGMYLIIIGKDQVSGGKMRGQPS